MAEEGARTAIFVQNRAPERVFTGNLHSQQLARCKNAAEGVGRGALGTDASGWNSEGRLTASFAPLEDSEDCRPWALGKGGGKEERD